MGSEFFLRTVCEQIDLLLQSRGLRYQYIRSIKRGFAGDITGGVRVF
jgi:hypothetical protein